MEKFVLVIHVIAALGVITLVLLQHGKGADMGASFGAGASGSLFGVSGSANFMSRATAAFVVVFFTTSLTLAYMASHKESRGSVIKANATQDVTPKAVDATTTVPVTTPAEADATTTQDIPK
ncbi:MAG: preprotein translocase subunit SecG [Methylotenera sp.]|nr:preprotein translocase subunit SecG [Methylotenera sp.]